MPRPPRGPLKDEGPQSNLLVVEGSDDFHAFISLFDAHKIRSQCRLEDGGGYERMRDSIDTRVDESGLERIGFVVDADENITDRWHSLQGALSLARYASIPDVPDPAGTIIREEGRRTIGIWIMPNNNLPGALEEFIRLLVPEDDLLWSHAEKSVAELPAFPKDLEGNWQSKAKIHTWLAWQEEPGKPIGQAITKRYLNPKAEEAQRLVNWLRRLFALDIAVD